MKKMKVGFDNIYDAGPGHVRLNTQRLLESEAARKKLAVLAKHAKNIKLNKE